MLTKILFKLRKPTLVLLGGEKSALAFKALCCILNCQPGATFKQLLLKKIVLLPLVKQRDFLKSSSRSIIGLGLMPEPLLKELYDLGALLRVEDVIVYASESKKGERTASASKTRSLSFGNKIGDDLIISDIRRDRSNTNFKVSFRGNTVPFWLNGNWDKLEIYAALLAISVCLELKSNLVQVSQALKNFEK